MLLTFNHVLQPAELAEIQTLLAQAPWEDGQLSAGPQARPVKNNQQLPHTNAAAERIRATVLAGLDRLPAFFSATLPLKVFTPRVNRYSVAHSHYGAHIDNAVRVLPNGQRVRTDISCTVFLNNPEDYEGGELTIHDSYGQHRIKLAAGSAVVYPGTSLHEVSPVTRGQRLACFFWIESMVRSDEHRQLLHELDTNLQTLRQRHGETTETTALTGVYHNLLRQWSNT